MFKGATDWLQRATFRVWTFKELMNYTLNPSTTSPAPWLTFWFTQHVCLCFSILCQINLACTRCFTYNKDENVFTAFLSFSNLISLFMPLILQFILMEYAVYGYCKSRSCCFMSRDWIVSGSHERWSLWPDLHFISLRAVNCRLNYSQKRTTVIITVFSGITTIQLILNFINNCIFKTGTKYIKRFLVF